MSNNNITAVQEALSPSFIVLGTIGLIFAIYITIKLRLFSFISNIICVIQCLLFIIPFGLLTVGVLFATDTISTPTVVSQAYHQYIHT
jgi:hypothetical protein